MFLGVDIGSVSLKLALLDAGGGVRFTHYRRTAGRPAQALREALDLLQKECGIDRFAGVTRLPRLRRRRETHAEPDPGDPHEGVYLGLDLGSVSTKGEAVQTGADAVINAICHNCMVGMASDTIFKRMAEEPGAPPVVTLAFDGLQETNTDTRLEAVCERAKARRRSGR